MKFSHLATATGGRDVIQRVKTKKTNMRQAYCNRKQQLLVWVYWMWSQAYLPQDIHENVETASGALKQLSNYQFDSCRWSMVVSLGIRLLLHECHHAQEYEADEAGDDVPNYLGKSILGFQMGNQIEEKVIGIGAEVKAMLKDENLGLSIV
jgi:hypothetical protein